MESKLTLQDHVELGTCLRIASDKLTKTICEIKPKTKARESKESKALIKVDELRSLLEDIMIKDHGQEGDKKFHKPNWWQDIYYGDAGRRD